jgi:hypothetical protein
VPNAKQPQFAKRKQADTHSQRVAQYATQLWLVQIAKLIDDLHYQNFHIPVLLHQQRVRHNSDENSTVQVDHVYKISDYVDSQEQFSYTTPEWPLREYITPAELQQLQSINAVIHTALTNKSITLSQLRGALRAEQMQEFTHSLQVRDHISEIMYGNGKPETLREYNKLLNKADFRWAAFEAVPTMLSNGQKRTHSAVGRMEDRAISLYEDALECLSDIFFNAKNNLKATETHIALQMWMDRPVDFDAGIYSDIDTNPYAMPRVRGSKSIYAKDSGLPKLSKRIKGQYCALLALLAAACELAFVLPEQQENFLSQDQQAQQRIKLQDLLRKIKSR